MPTFTPAVVSNPDLDLLCYKAKRATKQIEQSGCGSVNTKDKGTKITPKQDKHAKRTSIFINNQFGPLAMDSIREDELCIPSRTIFPE